MCVVYRLSSARMYDVYTRKEVASHRDKIPCPMTPISRIEISTREEKRGEGAKVTASVIMRTIRFTGSGTSAYHLATIRPCRFQR